MIVMPSNNSGLQVGYLCGKFPGRLGWLIGPGGWREPPRWMPVALDNGAFGAWVNNTEWDEDAWWQLLEVAHARRPLWAIVPDVVGNREATIERWHQWFPVVRKAFPRLPLAMAVQDGMTAKDVPATADVVFVGGTGDKGRGWKWRTLTHWTSNFPRVHVGRVGSERLLWMAHNAGAESCDSTGWTRGGEERIAPLERYLELSSKKDGHPQMVLDLT